jgi:hypothetical protein
MSISAISANAPPIQLGAAPPAAKNDHDGDEVKGADPTSEGSDLPKSTNPARGQNVDKLA